MFVKRSSVINLIYSGQQQFSYTSDLNEEVNHTEPSPLVSVPWHACFMLSQCCNNQRAIWLYHPSRPIPQYPENELLKAPISKGTF